MGCLAAACNAGDGGSIPGSGRSPGRGNSTPLQYSCLRNPMDREAWRVESMGSQELDRTLQLNHHGPPSIRCSPAVMIAKRTSRHCQLSLVARGGMQQNCHPHLPHPQLRINELKNKQRPGHRGTHKPYQGTWNVLSREEGASEATRRCDQISPPEHLLRVRL